MGYKVKYTEEDKMHDEYLKRKKRNKYCKGQKAGSRLFREHYNDIKWDNENIS